PNSTAYVCLHRDRESCGRPALVWFDQLGDKSDCDAIQMTAEELREKDEKVICGDRSLEAEEPPSDPKRSAVSTTQSGLYLRTVLAAAPSGRRPEGPGLPLIVIYVICTNTNCVNTGEHGSP
ncbi:hypothetical protein GBF38_022574, partial [Nibea albiflora]